MDKALLVEDEERILKGLHFLTIWPKADGRECLRFYNRTSSLVL